MLCGGWEISSLPSMRQKIVNGMREKVRTSKGYNDTCPAEPSYREADGGYEMHFCLQKSSYRLVSYPDGHLDLMFGKDKRLTSISATGAKPTSVTSEEETTYHTMEALSHAIDTLLDLKNTGDATEPVLTRIDDILAKNPMPNGATFQVIKVAMDDTASAFVVRLLKGGEIKPHLHKTHTENLYIVGGNGKLLINKTWSDIKGGSFHFNPMGKIHAIQNTGEEPLIAISVFSPAMKEPDRHFVE